MPIIEVDHVTKEYRLGQLSIVKQTAIHLLSRLRGQTIKERKPFKALDNVNFCVEPGEVLGIIGHNGAGKSTLLKMLANVSTPTSGKVKVKGKIAPLIEVGAGFVPDLTGRENVYLNGAILGLTRKEISKKFDEIVDFAEMAEFIDTPIKRYSSGMQVKLAFSVATSIEAEILIVDEVLAVGDLAFQRKCFDRMEDLIKRQGKTVLLVSHNIRQVERICSRVILLNSGRLVGDGTPKEICNAFYEQSERKIQSQKATASSKQSLQQGVDLLKIEILDENGKLTENIPFNGELRLAITYRIQQRITRPVFGFGVHTTDLLYLASMDTKGDFFDKPLDPGDHLLTCKVASFPFNPGSYSIRLAVADGESMVFYGENLAEVHVVDPTQSLATIKEYGFVPLNMTWDINNTQTHRPTISR
jgi:ABC-type polysaccharide/polyol phosphate transport system ATPase subunit